MNALWITCIRGTDKPDFIVADSTEYNFFEASLQQYQRFSDASEAEMGFEALKYKTADFFYDEIKQRHGLLLSEKQMDDIIESVSKNPRSKNVVLIAP